jgi:ABC-type phosphate transport system substrate-binding protein
MKIRELSLILALALVACLSIAIKAQAQIIQIDGSSTVFPITKPWRRIQKAKKGVSRLR